MKRHSETLIVLVITAAALIGQAVWHRFLFSLLPLPIVLSVMLVWSGKRRAIYIPLLIMIAELFSTQPPGIMTLVVLTPLVIWRISGVDVDISFSFTLIVAVTVLLQIIEMLGYDLLAVAWREGGVAVLGQNIPWQVVGLTWVLSSAVAVTGSILVRNWLPPVERGMISLEGKQIRQNY